jgi:transcriptional regulator with XRE-family HTH domain
MKNKQFATRRKALGLTQATFSSIAGVHPATVGKWEITNPPTLAFLALEALEGRAMRARFAAAMKEIQPEKQP